MIKHTITSLKGPTQTFVFNRELTLHVERAAAWYVNLPGYGVCGCGDTLPDALRNLGAATETVWISQRDALDRNIASRLKNVVERVDTHA